MPLPSSPPWFELFDVEEEDIKEICLTILRLYARKKVNLEICYQMPKLCETDGNKQQRNLSYHPYIVHSQKGKSWGLLPNALIVWIWR